ncbi:MAG: hypothetical protein AB7D00_00450 [Rhodospirillaceae bacterium]
MTARPVAAADLRHARERLRLELRAARALLDAPDAPAPVSDGLRQLADAADAETRAKPGWRADLEG